VILGGSSANDLHDPSKQFDSCDERVAGEAEAEDEDERSIGNVSR